MGASIGISLFPEDGDAVEALLKNADAAMYKAKEAGGNRFEFYDRTMTKTAFARLSLEGTLRKALERNELELYFQPQVDVRSRETRRCRGAPEMAAPGAWADPAGRVHPAGGGDRPDRAPSASGSCTAPVP